MRLFLFGFAIAACILFAACGSRQESEPAIGVAYAGPATLKLHEEIDPKSTTVAVVHHGDKLEIVAQRRRWYRVRTAKSAVGWATDRDLLDRPQMRRLETLAASTKGLPSQGAATTFNVLNVHSEPSRQAASFIQVEPKEQFDVIARRVVERVPLPRHELIPPRPKAVKREASKKGSVPRPPAPVPPTPPEDWVTLSHEREPDPEDLAKEEKATPHDDWTLIRMKNGESGWVLTSAIYLEIPDEVAQYAEGKRITSYFSLGKIRDGDLQKDIWLWTTSTELGEDHDFDSYRVFVWSLRHHRYETSYIQRRERGYFPVLAKTGEFSVCLEQDDGSRIRTKYQMDGNRVSVAGTQPCPKFAEEEGNPLDFDEESPALPRAKRSLVARVEGRIKAFFQR